MPDHVLTPPQRRLLVRIGRVGLYREAIYPREEPSLRSLWEHGYAAVGDHVRLTSKGLDELERWYAGLE